MKEVKVGEVVFSETSLGIIAGPCVIENREHSLKMALEIKKISESVKIPIIFKSSFDKANRTSIKSFRGPGIEEGLKILSNFIFSVSNCNPTWTTKNFIADAIKGIRDVVGDIYRDIWLKRNSWK